MRNQIEVFIFVVASIVCVPILIILFPSVHLNCEPSGNGDLATWVSAGVSLLALLMAGYAAYLGKKASDVATENSTILSLSHLIEQRADKANQLFFNLKEALNGYRNVVNLFENGSVPPNVLEDNFFLCTDKIRSFALDFRKVIINSFEDIDVTNIKNSSKKTAKIRFVQNLSSEVMAEILWKEYTLWIFVSFSEHVDIKRRIYEIYEKPIECIEQTGLYSKF